MFERLKNLITGGSSPENPPQASQDEIALAVSALLVEAAQIDGDYAQSEQQLIDTLLQSQFEFTEAEAGEMRARGEAAQTSANDLYQFTRVVNDAMAAEEKIGLVERLWEVVLSDGERHHYEDYLVRRVIGLIHVSDQDSGAARRRVAARLEI